LKTRTRTIEELERELGNSQEVEEIVSTTGFIRLTDGLHAIREAARDRLEIDPDDDKARQTALGIREFFRILKLHNDNREAIAEEIYKRKKAKKKKERNHESGLHGAPKGL